MHAPDWRYACLLVLSLASLLTGCSPNVGEKFRDITDYDAVRERLPEASIDHLPDTLPAGSRLYASFVPMQGGSTLDVEVPCAANEFERLLADTVAKNYRETHGVNENDPQSFINGSPSPQILTGNKPEIPTPDDRIFIIEDGNSSDTYRGMTFRTAKHTIVYWTYVDR
ncbi:MAG: hypothetical protein ACR2NP_12685 [Pirellulaceae bacterium]